MEQVEHKGWSRFAGMCQNMILLVFAAIMLVLAVFSLFFTADNIAVANRMSQQVKLVGDAWPPNLLMTALFLCGLGIASRFLQRLGIWRCGIVMGAAFIAAGLFWALGVQMGQRADAQTVLDAAQQFAQGNYELLNEDYFSVHSYQLGQCFPLEGLARLFPGADLNVMAQCINVGIGAATMIALSSLAQTLFGEKKDGVSCLLLYVLFLPAVFYCGFVYGVTPMVLLDTCAFIGFSRYVRTGRYRDGALYAVSAALALMIKPHALVPMLALGVCGVLHALRKQNGNVLGFVAASFVLGIALRQIVIAQYALRGGVAFREDISFLARFAMGMGESPIAPGWYNGYTEQFWAAEHSSQQFSELVMRDIATRLTQMKNDPAMAAAFYGEKFLTQWLEPGYDILWLANVSEKMGRFNGIANLLLRDGFAPHRMLDGLLNVYQQAVYLLVFVGTLSAMRRESSKDMTVIALTVMGGMLYHLLFEAKAQYAFPYLIYMMPLAAHGLTMFCDGCGGLARRLSRRQRGDGGFQGLHILDRMAGDGASHRLGHKAGERAAGADFHHRIHAELRQAADGVLHVDALADLADEQLCDGLFALHIAQTVEEHGDAHFAEGLRFKALRERAGCRLHQRGVEWAAYAERKQPPCARRFGQLACPGDGGFFAADDELTGAVVVANAHDAQGSGLLAAGGKRLAVKAQHGRHAAFDARRGIGHGPAAESGQRHGSRGGKHPGGLQRAVFAQAQACGVCRLNAALAQHGGDACGKGDHAGLRVLRLADDALRVVKADLLEVKAGIGIVEYGAESGVCLIQIAPHSGALGALSGI